MQGRRLQGNLRRRLFGKWDAHEDLVAVGRCVKGMGSSRSRNSILCYQYCVIINKK